MGVFMLGDALDGFMGRKLKQINYSDPLNQAYNNLIPNVKNVGDANSADIESFASALRGARAKDSAAQDGDIALLQGAANRLANSGGLDDYRAIGDYNKSFVSDAAKSMVDLSSGADKLALARLGYGGRGPSTFQTRTTADRVARNTAPLWQSALSSIAPGVTAVGQTNRGNAVTLADLINEKAGIPFRGIDSILDPSRARSNNLQATLQALGLLGSGVKSNTAGFKEEKNKLAAGFQAIDGGLNSALDTVLSLYSGGLAGGGGGMGGLFGGGKAAPANAGTGGGYDRLMAMLNTG